ncbi:putative congenital dyserythropoietic anemia type I, partial [Operophtera brumata]
MPHTIIESVLTGKLDSMLLIKWLNNEAIEDDCIVLSCKRSGFVACFLSYLRNQTDSILLTNSNAVQILQNSTPDKALSSRQKHHRSISEPTSDERDSVSVKTEKSQSPNRDRKRPGRRVKTKLFSEDHKDGNISVSSDESRLSNSIDRMAITSTPLKNSGKVSEYSNRSLSSPLTPQNFSKDGERCDTPRLSHRHSRSHEKSCLGDFIVTATKSSKKKPKMSVSNETEERIELDLSNSEMFPEIGARKSSSLRGEKKRIKPTNIDTSQKSISLNSFNSECFQQPSSISHEENSAFKHQKFQPKETSNSFEAERNILKQERHKLMEKFNILNTATPQKVSTMPQIKINQKESIEINQSYVKADVTKILLKDKVDLLIDIYDNLLKNNLILSVITEIYFLISIVISKQVEDDYINTESKLKDNNIEYLLKSIHNSSYFAIKSLWNIRTTLE